MSIAQSINWDHLDMFTGGDILETEELLSDFLENTAEILSVLIASHTNEDMNLWRDTSHKLKGSAYTVGADILGKSCELAEKNWQDEPALKTAYLEQININNMEIQKLHDLIKHGIQNGKSLPEVLQG